MVAALGRAVSEEATSNLGEAEKGGMRARGKDAAGSWEHGTHSTTVGGLGELGAGQRARGAPTGSLLGGGPQLCFQ